jgi:hypothetical protein
MATPKKKHLIELMIEAGVKWPDGAEYAAQDKDEWLAFYTRKPYREDGKVTWSSYRCYVANSMKKLDLLCRNWHQTIVTLEQYSEALAANVGEPAAMASKSNQVRENEDVPSVDAVEWHNPPSIEQLTADYHAKAAEADRLQAVADDALKAADDALLALEKAGELIGLVISIDTKPKQVEITDWRDLRVGDVVEHVEHNGGSAKIGSHGVVIDAHITHILVDYPDHKGYVYSVPECQHKFRFIRRP